MIINIYFKIFVSEIFFCPSASVGSIKTNFVKKLLVSDSAEIHFLCFYWLPYFLWIFSTTIKNDFIFTSRCVSSEEKSGASRIYNFANVDLTAWPVKSRQMSIKSGPKMISLENEHFDTFKNCLKCGRIGQSNCCQGLWKVAISAINRPIWSHWLCGMTFRLA